MGRNVVDGLLPSGDAEPSFINLLTVNRLEIMNHRSVVSPVCQREFTYGEWAAIIEMTP
jgi:hypothetical protein